MLKTTLALLIASLSTIAFAETIPTTIQKFIPKNYEILSQASGDLNADGQVDTAIIIQTKNIKIQNRKLLILFKQGGQYQQILSKQIPNWTYRDDENCINDALFDDGVSIKNHVLRGTCKTPQTA